MPPALAGGDCARTSVGLTPLNDLGAGSHQGFQGGLYPGGANVHPDVAAGIAVAQGIGPLDSAGKPSAAGRYALISIGMSNTTQEFKPFVEAATVDEARDPALVVIDGAQGGWVGDKIIDPAQNEVYWGRIANRLAKAGLSHEQVAVAWVKTAHDTERDHADEEFPADAEALRDTMRSLAQLLLDKFPNLALAYFSTRTYAGYAVTELSPEPHAWQGGFAAKWLIESQIMGAPELNHDPAHGAVNAPFLLWGPYLWADGLTPRGDGFTWTCADFMDDGTHPSPSGRQKVADVLWRFVRTDPTAREWYLKDTPNAAPAVAIEVPAGPTSIDEGEPAGFAGTATDTEDGELTAGIKWASSLDGLIGIGGAFEAVLSGGVHTVSASVADSGGLTGSAEVTVSVGVAGNTVPVVSIDAPADGAVFDIRETANAPAIDVQTD